ncbi:MAG: hypothetical protein KH338_10175 [Oscillospiraceae bacterium]|nr:hypothetical protein [Oscillospiraceae bacterium]
MKKKYLAPAAAAAAALGLLAAALLWYGRSQAFRAVFPLSGSVEVSCQAQWTPEDGQGYAKNLTGEQVGQVLGALKGQQFRRRYGDLLPWGGKGAVTSSMEDSLLLTFRDRSGASCELLFLGDRIWVHDLEQDRRASYALSGGQTFQVELTRGVYELVHPKAETVGTVYADLNGDGSDETVRLCVEETVEPDESGIPLVTGEAALRPYHMETEVDGRTVTCPLGDVGERYEGVERLFVTADRSGAPVIVAGLPAERETGELAVYALSWEPGTGSFIRLEAPRYSIQGLLEGTTAHVVVPETGNAEDLDLNWWLSRQNVQTVPGTDRAAQQPGAPEQAGGICAVGPAEQGIRVAQPLWNRDQTVKMGWLVTQVTWMNGAPAVVSQYFDWQAGAAEDVLR